jgi:hypothetical protein
MTGFLKSVYKLMLMLEFEPDPTALPLATVSACEALIPTNQSARLLPTPASCKLSKSFPDFRFSNPLKIAFSVNELIHIVQV